MSDTSAHLSLPYLMASQAQKHVTMNEALRLLDGIVQLSVLDRDLTAPPASPADGARYIPASGATGAWAGWDGNVAYWVDGAWLKLVPQIGWIAWVADEGILIGWTGTAWQAVGGSSDPSFNTVGIGGAVGDATNRLSISAPATLLNHAGAGHQVKINKNAVGDTASLLYQTNWSGRAEMGLAGNNDFSIKTSLNGSAWRDSFVINNATGYTAIGGGTPTRELTIYGGSPGIALTRSNGFVFDISWGSSVVNMDSYVASGPAFISINPRATDGVSPSGFRFFRSTETTGGATFDIYRGDNSPAIRTRIDTSIGGLTYISQTPDGGNVSIGSGSDRGGKLNVQGAILPVTNNAHALGNATYKWSEVWATNGTIQTSDARQKDVIGSPADFALEFVDLLAPVMFRWKDGAEFVSKEPAFEGQEPCNQDAIDKAASLDDPFDLPLEYVHKRPGRRVHAGFLAQDVRSAMDAVGVDFGAWGLEDAGNPDSAQFLRPDQLVPVLWAAVKALSREVADLRAHVGVPAEGP